MIEFYNSRHGFSINVSIDVRIADFTPTQLCHQLCHRAVTFVTYIYNDLWQQGFNIFYSDG